MATKVTPSMALLAANAIRAEHMKRLSRAFPPASARGEYPRRRTGNLRSGIIVTKVGKGYEIGYADRAFYGAILELKLGRLGIRHTAVDVFLTGKFKGVRWVKNPGGTITVS